MKSQRGNIIVYLLVGVVLFGALLGSIWWVKSRYSMAQPAQQTEQTANTPEVQQDATEANPATPREETTGSNNQPRQDASTNSSTPAPTTEAPRTGPSQPSPGAVAASGPTENLLVSAALLGLITYQASSFFRSRQARL